MRIQFITAVIVTAILAAAGPAFAGKTIGSRLTGKQTLKFETNKRNQLEWLSDAPGEKIRGSAPGVTGTVTVDPADLSSARGKLIVPVATMKTGNDMRDRHLRGKDWLEAKKFANIEFDITGVDALNASAGKATFKARGKFTLHGVSKDLTIPITLKWKDASAGAKVKIETRFKVALADFKIAGKRGVVGDKVGKEIEIWGTLYGATR